MKCTPGLSFGAVCQKHGVFTVFVDVLKTRVFTCFAACFGIFDAQCVVKYLLRGAWGVKNTGVLVS